MICNLLTLTDLKGPQEGVIPTKQCRLGNIAQYYFANTCFFVMCCQKLWYVTCWNYWPALFCKGCHKRLHRRYHPVPDCSKNPSVWTAFDHWVKMKAFKIKWIGVISFMVWYLLTYILNSELKATRHAWFKVQLVPTKLGNTSLSCISNEMTMDRPVKIR